MEDRTKAFLEDTEFLYKKRMFGTWYVKGNKTGYEYKSGLNEDQAKKYAAELNQNKQNLVLWD